MDVYNFCPLPVSNANCGPVGLFNNFILNCGITTYNSRYGMVAKFFIKYNVLQTGISIYPGGNNFLNNYDTYISQNIFDGSYYCLFSSISGYSTKSVIGRIFVSKNLVKSNIQQIINGLISSDLYDNDSFILNSKDSSTRPNRWEYNGIFNSYAYNTNSILESFGVIQYNKYDAVISHSQYGVFIKYPNTQYTRFYGRNIYNSSSLPNTNIITGATINKQSDESVFIEVDLKFKISSDLYYQSNSNIGGGLPYLIILRDGLEIYRYTITTKSLEYMNIYYNDQLSGVGSFNIIITTNSFNGFIDIKSSYFQSWGGSNKTKVLANTFDMLNNGIYDRVLEQIINTKPYKNSDNINEVTDVRVNRRISGL